MSSSTSGKGDEWRLLIPLTVNQQSENPISCLKFDPYEELVWCGSTTGKVTSFSASNQFNRYSAFVSSRIGGVNAIEITEDVVFSLSETCLRGTTRQGLPISKYSSPSMTKMSAFFRFPATTILVMGGEQNKILQYDYNKEREVRTSQIAESGAIIIRYNGTNLYTADCDGNVCVRNPKTLETVQRIPCHGDRISDFDVHGSKLITCGYSQKFKSAHADPFVKVFDLRMYKALLPIPLTFFPSVTRFLPTYCEKIIVASQLGAVRISEFNSNSIGTSFVVESNGISAFDFSSSKQFMAFGDYTGNVNLYCDGNEPVINENSFESIFAYPPVGPPVSFSIDDHMTSLASVPMPFPEDDSLASDWPSELTQPIFRKQKPFEEHEDVKVLHNVTHIKNPRINSKLRRHNIVPYIIEEEPVRKIEAQENVVVDEATKIKVSKFYKKCPIISVPVIRKGQTIEDLRRMYNYNPTNHVAIQSSYYINVLVNPVVHFLYHLIALRNILFSHICVEEKCVACQMRFLFSMITDKSQSSPVSSINLVRTLISNGFQLDTSNVLKSTHNAIEIIIESVSEISEYLGKSENECMLDENEKTCLRTEFNVIYRCVRCGAIQTIPPSRDYAIKLNYSIERKGSNPSFCQMIEKTLHLGCNSSSNEERECEDCKAKSRMEHKRRVKSLPSILLIDTNPKNEQFAEFWQRQLSVYERRPVRGGREEPDSPAENKTCRYGSDCRNKKTCKFSHGRIDWEVESSNLLKDVYDDGWEHYLPTMIGAQVNGGIVRMTDVSNCPEYDEPNSEVFELVGMVAGIGCGEHPVEWSHTVTLIKDQSESLPWSMINEQLICRVHENEAVHLDPRWKLPLMLAYRKKGFNVSVEKRESIPESLFYLNDNLATNATSSSGNSEIQLPGKGELVGIDAEFIKIRWGKIDKDGKGVTSRAVGRVSCVDSSGTNVIFDDHVQVISEEDVTDYLTEFSGIISDDLDATKSSKFLTTLKRVYLKILILVQRGCIFVGHALNNDFTVLNIHVPKEQIIDTVNLLRLDSHRLLALQFLALQLLGDKIQEDSHDSVVDAQYALKIYRKYLELKENGSLNSEMRRIYDIVKSSSPTKRASPANSLTENK